MGDLWLLEAHSFGSVNVFITLPENDRTDDTVSECRDEGGGSVLVGMEKDPASVASSVRMYMPNDFLHDITIPFPKYHHSARTCQGTLLNVTRAE